MADMYEYSYEWDVRYCYENSNVLRNKLNIMEAGDLHAAEREIAAIRILEATRQPIRGKLDFKHLCAIHKYIFGDIYEWAGNLRTVNISKGNPFCNCMYLENFSEDVFSKLKVEKFLTKAPPESIAERLAYYLSEINVLHPFREGNGRAQRVFIEYVAKAAGWYVDFSDVTADEMIEASALAFALEYRKMTDIFRRITTPLSKEEQFEFRLAVGLARKRS